MDFSNFNKRPIKKIIFTEDQITWVKKNYQILGAKSCSRFLSISTSTLNRLLRKLNIYKIRCHNNSNIEQFIKVTNPIISYFLGFLWADGHINLKNYSILLAIIKSDGLEVEKNLQGLFKYRFHIYKKSGMHKDQAYICLYDIELIKLLVKLDYTRKSKVAPSKILKHIPKHLHHYFWLGYFDGDGSIYIAKTSKGMTFTAAIDYDWKEHIKLFKRLRIFPKIEKSISNGARSKIATYSRKNMLKLGNYLYSTYRNDFIGLSRKYNKFLYLLNKKPLKYLSKYKGVSKHKDCRSWHSFIQIKNRTKHLGSFRTEKEAAKAYDQCVLENHLQRKLNIKE